MELGKGKGDNSSIAKSTANIDRSEANNSGIGTIDVDRANNLSIGIANIDGAD